LTQEGSDQDARFSLVGPGTARIVASWAHDPTVADSAVLVVTAGSPAPSRAPAADPSRTRAPAATPAPARRPRRR
jgi:hypothetical protein